MLATITGGSLGILAALNGWGIWALVVQQLVVAFLMLALTASFARWLPVLEFRLRRGFSLIAFGVNIMGSQLASVGSRNLDNVLIGTVIGTAALGVYSLAYRLYEAASELMVGAIVKVAQVEFAALKAEPEQQATRYYEALGDTTSIAFPSFILIAFLAPVYAPALLGPEWRLAGTIASWLFMAACMTTLSRFSMPMLLAAGKARLAFRISILNVCLNFIAFVIGVQIGVVAVAMAFFVKTICMFPIGFHFVRRYSAVTTSGLARNLWRQLLALIALIVLCGAVRVLAGDTILAVTLGGVVAASLYLVLLWLFDRARVVRLLSGIR
jgi:PST family polysaccharide transporter